MIYRACVLEEIAASFMDAFEIHPSVVAVFSFHYLPSSRCFAALWQFLGASRRPRSGERSHGSLPSRPPRQGRGDGQTPCRAGKHGRSLSPRFRPRSRQGRGGIPGQGARILPQGGRGKTQGRGLPALLHPACFRKRRGAQPGARSARIRRQGRSGGGWAHFGRSLSARQTHSDCRS